LKLYDHQKLLLHASQPAGYFFVWGHKPLFQTHRTLAFQSETAYFKVAFPPTQDTFVIALSNPQQIQEARDIVQGREQNKIHVMGTSKDV